MLNSFLNAKKKKEMSAAFPQIKKPTTPTAAPTMAPDLKKIQAYTDTQRQKRIDSDMGFFNSYNETLKSGTADLTKFDQYKQVANQYGKKTQFSSVSPEALQKLSIAALGGDANAKKYLETMKYKQLSGDSLWKGITGDNASQYLTSAKLRGEYMKANPYTDYTKGYEMNHYNKFVEKIINNEPMTPQELTTYQKFMEKWKLDDANDPLVQNKMTLEKGKKTAMDAQDTALNQGLVTQDHNNFQRFQELSQQMSNRGIQGSGMEADAYMRSQMAANANYQNAFSEAATTKAQLGNEFDQQINDARSAIVDQKSKSEQAKQEAIAKQDEFLTTQTGRVYVGGKPLMSGGKPVTTLEFQKLSEIQRHNLAEENNVSVGQLMDFKAKMDANAAKRENDKMDYSQGMDKNAVARQKIAADLQISIAKNKIDQAKLDLGWAELEASNAQQQEKISIAAANAQTAADKNQLTSLGKQSDSISKQIVALQKKKKLSSAEKETMKKLVSKYNTINGQISALVGGSGFNSSGGGGGTLGSLSKKYESGSAGAGTIANNAGDWGGKSYGTYQIATNTGTMNSFMKYLQRTNSRIYNGLGRYSIGSSGFDQAWKQLAAADPEFEKLQHNFIKGSHYDPVVQNLRGLGLDINNRSSALQNAVWSMGVQHGSGGATGIFKAAGITNNMSDRDIIIKIYNERMKVDKYFSRSSASIKASVKRRFQNELQDALRMLG